jgi:hypothetical protein
MARPKGSKNTKTTVAKAVKRRIQRPDIKIPDDYHEEIAFLSNPRIKKAGVPIEFTPEQIMEIAKCADDPIYFIEKYIKIITVDEGLVPIVLRDYQKDIILAYKENRYVICKLPRQTGKTTCTTGFILWYVLFQQHKTVGILAQKEKIANEILTKIKLAYEHLPMFIQQGVMEWNKSTIAIENGCRIICETTSSGSIRGFAINLLYLDEFAHVPTNIADEFFTSVWPTISSGESSKMIMTSTPNGMNMFYKFWQDAIKQFKKPEEWNGFVAKEVHYSVVPGRDAKWAARELNILKERKFAQEVLCEFIGSSHTLISGKKLRELAVRDPEKLELDSMLKVYQDPIPNHAYVLSADPSEGKELDYHCFTIFDVTTDVWSVAAKFRNNEIDTLLFASSIYQSALHYNNAYCIVENNSIGALVLKELVEELDYDNCFFSLAYQGDQTVSQTAKAKIPGVKTTKRTKMQGCNKLKLLLETNQLIVEDFDMVEELSTFVLQKTGTYAAEPGYNDDTVSTLWLFAWLTNQTVFKDITDLNLRRKLHSERLHRMEEQMPAMPIIESNAYRKVPIEKVGNDLWLDSSMGFDDALEIIRDFNNINTREKPDPEDGGMSSW